MIQPYELTLKLPVELSNGIFNTTNKVWEILKASEAGDIIKVKELVAECPELVYAQYNYMPPIHLAVREGHVELVKYFLENGAYDPGYKIYPFLEPLQTIARDRDYFEIADLLDDYTANTSRHRFKGDNGRILYDRTDLQNEFEQAVDQNNLERTKTILEEHPGFAKDPTYFWSEGILLFAAKENSREMIDLLMSYGAKVPAIVKWAQFYYFENDLAVPYLLQKGMSPDIMSCHRVTILHDMAQKANLNKAALLIDHNADINAIDEEYQSTCLGMAVRWGHVEMVQYLLERRADPNAAGAPWATPLAWARKKGWPAIEKLLLQAGAKPDI